MIGLMVCSREAVKSMRERGVDDGHVFLISRLVCTTTGIGIGPCIVRERLACVDTAVMFSVYFCFYIHCITDYVVLRSDSFLYFNDGLSSEKINCDA